VRLALGVRYNGQAYQGWQSQLSGQTVQDKLEAALSRFAASPVSTLCAGRTDAGVHGLMQVVHFDTDIQRTSFSWVRGTNRYLPADIAIQWAHPVPEAFHCRASALALAVPGAAKPRRRSGWMVDAPAGRCCHARGCRTASG